MGEPKELPDSEYENLLKIAVDGRVALRVQVPPDEFISEVDILSAIMSLNHIFYSEELEVDEDEVELIKQYKPDISLGSPEEDSWEDIDITELLESFEPDSGDTQIY